MDYNRTQREKVSKNSNRVNTESSGLIYYKSLYTDYIL